MAYPVTLNQFLKNPSGYGSASLARRDIIRADLEKRYLSLYRSAKKQFNVTVYTDKSNNYFFHFNIPSEFYYNQGLYYDVVIEFLTNSRVQEDLTLSRYQINMFSNSPNFQFTYAYVYNKDGNLIHFLNRKLSSKSLTVPPSVRNPNETHGFEKSVYFAGLYMREHPEIMTKATNKPNKLVIMKFLNNITSSTAKLKEYKIAQSKFRQSESKKKSVQKMLDKSRKSVHNLEDRHKARRTIDHDFKKVVKKQSFNHAKDHSKKLKSNKSKRKIHFFGTNKNLKRN